MTTEIENERSARTGPDPETEAVRRLFRRACTRPATERAAWVRANASSPAVAEEVLSLLAHLEDTARDAVPADPLLGRTLDGWTLLEPVGEGGSGRVYLAERDGVRGAFKLLHAKHSGSEGKAGHRVSIERSALERLSHPAIVRLLDHGTVEIDGTARDYLVTEFVEDAEPLLEGAMRDGLTIEQRITLLAEIAEAVGHAHAAGVVHRDLKPENIVLDGTGRPRILDFGIARLDAGSADDRDARAGSRATLAPEQIDPRRGPVTARTDVYALGVIGYRLVTGEAPYDVGTTLASAAQAILHVPAMDPRIACPTLTPTLGNVLVRAIHKSPLRRFRDANALRQAILFNRPRKSISRVLLGGTAVLAVGLAFARSVPHSTTYHPPSADTLPTGSTQGEEMFPTHSSKTMTALATSLGLAASAMADLPIINPTETIPLATTPSDDWITLCGEDIVYVRNDRSLRLLRKESSGTWSDTALPGQQPLGGTNVTFIFGHGHLLAALLSNQTGEDRLEIYERDAGGAWSRKQTITAPTSGSFAYPQCADWSGDMLIVGDRYADSYRGSAYVFRRGTTGLWSQEAKLQGSLATPNFTELWSTQIDDDLAVLGHWLSPCGYGAPSGRIYAFRRAPNGTWSEEAIIRPSWAACGDGFGMTIAIGHQRILNLTDTSAPYSVKQFIRSGSAWQQAADIAMPSGLGAAQRMRPTSWGILTMEAQTGSVLVSRLTETGFENMALLRPTATLGSAPNWVNLGVSETRCVVGTPVSANSCVISVYDLSPLLDCDNDGIPNSDEIAAGAPDCDANGIPDSCEGSGEHVSPTKAPFGVGQSLVHTFTGLPNAAQDVTLIVEAKADLGGVSEFVTVKADGTTLTTLFGVDGQDCPAAAQSRTVTIPASQFNGFLTDGAVTIELVPSSFVAVKECPSSTALVRLVYPEQIVDCDGDGQSDACQIAAQPGLDKDGDGTIDGCNYAKGDFDLSDTIDGGDLAYLLALWGATNPPVGDLNGDAVVSAPDLGVLLANWGPITP